MTIKELRAASGMTQQAFSEYFGIPKRTIEDWEGERRTPPDYLIALIEYKLTREKEFINCLDNIHNSASEIEQIAKALKVLPAVEPYAGEIIDNVIIIRANVSEILNPPLKKKKQ